MASYQQLEIGRTYKGMTDARWRERSEQRVLIIKEATEEDYRKCLVRLGNLDQTPFLCQVYFYEVLTD